MINPITCLDYPDPDLIRVDDCYYMISTTMHFMPGGEILRSYDLVNWEHAAFVYDSLEDNPSHRLEDGKGIYGKGMWAGSLRQHQGLFYACFVANDTHQTYLFTATRIEGPWTRKPIAGFYHDCSLLFDGDRVFIAYGNTEIRITELAADLSGPKPGGLDRVAIKETGNKFLCYEGAHLYKIKGRYYLFLIHSRPDRWRRVEACFSAASIDGEFTGGDVLDADLGYCDQGVAQGGIIDTPDGDWYAMLFQDRGAVGRIPVLVPLRWEGTQPVLGEGGTVPAVFPVKSTRPGHVYRPLTGSDDFRGLAGKPGVLDPRWQWNHAPDNKHWRLDPAGGLVLESARVCRNLVQARNVLTQRMTFPRCSASVRIDGSGLRDGDWAGIAALQSVYGLIAFVREGGEYSVRVLHRPANDPSMLVMPPDDGPGRELARIPVAGPVVRLRLDADFMDMRDTATFWLEQEGWQRAGGEHRLYFKLDHFCGCRFGLFLFSTTAPGGSARFTEFRYQS